ncbi:MAG: ABC transporter substrate-binding protein [Acidobacteria bacterium]|nr:ABC transporter substrate-binding protein [Acidobacteriota bacterium]
MSDIVACLSDAEGNVNVRLTAVDRATHGTHDGTGGNAEGKVMMRMRVLGWIVIGLLPVVAGCGGVGDDRIVVGSKNFTEQLILAEIVAQQIESRLGIPVDRRVNLGGTLICHEALNKGDLDVYVEYTGTALMAILHEPLASDPSVVRERVIDRYLERFDLEWREPLGFNDTFAVIIRGEDARRHGLRTISDAVPHTADWRIGFSFEFLEREDGYRGMVKRYGLKFLEPPLTMDLGLVFRAIEDGRVEMIVGNSTDGRIAAMDLVALEDDLNYFPPYEAAPIVRRDALARYPELGAALDDLGGTISEDLMRRLNYAVDGEGRDIPSVAREFLGSLKP